MTFPNVVKLLFIFAPSFNLVPLAPVDSALSEPARSTSETLLTFNVSKLLGSRNSRNWRIILYLLCSEATVLIMFVLGEDDGEDSVGPAGRLVHVGGGHGPRLVALLHEVVDVVVAGDGQLAQVLHVGAEQRVLPHAEVALAVGVQEVADTLAVDLHVAHLRDTGLHLYI